MGVLGRAAVDAVLPDEANGCLSSWIWSIILVPLALWVFWPPSDKCLIISVHAHDPVSIERIAINDVDHRVGTARDAACEFVVLQGFTAANGDRVEIVLSNGRCAFTFDSSLSSRAEIEIRDGLLVAVRYRW